ncbi:vacuolar amino acid transporter 1-like [Olea europaea subsp. europaea]|uniref:Vacuolar amino acid transporter 1-like n=1 Tax=Olea europaea subsp. europaea TaxID=158383 RepID=A0A8S0U068_OLEEU|nr:vacuolar amino acid transporter 1-like [Olea europaea subsp. europaea]
MYLELFLLAVEFLILEGDNLHKLFPNVHFHIFGKNVGGKHVFVVLSALVMLPTTWLNLSFLAYVSVGGILASIILVGSVFSVGASEGICFKEQGVLWRWNGLPTAISLYTFCYCGHVVFPTLCSSMKNRSKFPKVLLICFTLSTINYGTMAILGYAMYGGNLMSMKSISSKISIYTTLINPITKYAIIVSPIASALDDALSSHSSKLARRPVRLIIKTVLVISTTVVATGVLFYFVTSLYGVFVIFFDSFKPELGAFVSIIAVCIFFFQMPDSYT